MTRGFIQSRHFRRARFWTLIAILPMLFAVSPSQAQIFQHLVFTSVTVPGATETEVTGTAIRRQGNGEGDIVGFYVDSRGVNHGFLKDTAGKITTIDVPGSTGTWVYGIELSAAYIAGSYTDSNLVAHGFLRPLPTGEFKTIDVPGAAWTKAYTVDLDGTVFGAYSGTDGAVHGFSFNDPFGGKGYKTLDFPGSARTEIHGSSNYGHGFAGIFVDSSGAEHGFLGSDGNFDSAIDFPGAGLTSVNGMASGTGSFLVGYYGASAAGPFHGFVANDGNGLYQTVDFPGSTDTRCTGMDDSPRITGRYTDSRDVVHGFLAVQKF